MVVPLPSLRNNDETGVVHPQTSKHNPPVWEGMGTEDTKQAVSHAFIKAAVQTLCKLSTLCDEILLHPSVERSLIHCSSWPLSLRCQRSHLVHHLFGHIWSGLLRVFTALWVVSCWIDLWAQPCFTFQRHSKDGPKSFTINFLLKLNKLLASFLYH